MNRRALVLAGVGACLTWSHSALGTTRYAKTNGTSSGPCSTWASACTLGVALSVAQAGEQLWVQGGTYGPVTLQNGVKTVGGFAGTESAASQSNPSVNVTVIDGGGASRCVTSANHSASTMLRGFTVRNGYHGDNDGGGALVIDNSSAMFVQCVFENNRAYYFGGAVAIRGSSSPQFVNCDFHGNGTGEGTSVHPYGGGAIYLYGGTATFTNCLFYNNRAGDFGVLLAMFGSATFNNCTIANNAATIGYGGGIGDPEGRTVVHNSILWGNTAVKGQPQIKSGLGLQTMVDHSSVQGGWPGTGNIDADPLFTSPATGGYALQSSSPCKNTGDNNAVPHDVADLDWDNNLGETVPKDLSLLLRIRFTTVDMGAYEVFSDTPPDGGG
jgi:hypothetical protein